MAFTCHPVRLPSLRIPPVHTPLAATVARKTQTPACVGCVCFGIRKGVGCLVEAEGDPSSGKLDRFFAGHERVNESETWAPPFAFSGFSFIKFIERARMPFGKAVPPNDVITRMGNHLRHRLLECTFAGRAGPNRAAFFAVPSSVGPCGESPARSRRNESSSEVKDRPAMAMRRTLIFALAGLKLALALKPGNRECP
ncbi:hypothetical protein ZHAS_00014406 [Anopheles sinensis]|uniref:Uncharacterized protein n=1 Tax=Anopheles sinensis TaxID=74873 RepID=A0A084W814_ANOSI|nr:hypothetical protein ZHAS_00014406 [Anopheles sinensis]